jgi:hypothetical protein
MPPKLPDGFQDRRTKARLTTGRPASSAMVAGARAAQEVGGTRRLSGDRAGDGDRHETRRAARSGMERHRLGQSHGGGIEVARRDKEGIGIKSAKSGNVRRFSIPASVLEVMRWHQKEQNEQRKMYGSDYASLNLARPDGQHYKVILNISIRYSGLFTSGISSRYPNALMCDDPHPARPARLRRNCGLERRPAREIRQFAPCKPLRLRCGGQPCGGSTVRMHPESRREMACRRCESR